MTTPYDKEIEKLLTQYRKQRSELGEMQRAIREISATATAVNRSVQVTVDAQGELKELSFPTNAFRTMPPAELASMIKRTVDQARTEATKSMRQVMKRYLTDNSSMINLAEGIEDGFTNWESLLPEEPLLPDQVRDFATHRQQTSAKQAGPNGEDKGR